MQFNTPSFTLLVPSTKQPVSSFKHAGVASPASAIWSFAPSNATQPSDQKKTNDHLANFSRLTKHFWVQSCCCLRSNACTRVHKLHSHLCLNKFFFFGYFDFQFFRFFCSFFSVFLVFSASSKHFFVSSSCPRVSIYYFILFVYLSVYYTKSKILNPGTNAGFACKKQKKHELKGAKEKRKKNREEKEK